MDRRVDLTHLYKPQHIGSGVFRKKGYVKPLLSSFESMAELNSKSHGFEDVLIHLTKSDKILAELIRNVGECSLARREDYFLSLVSAIINQQLSGSAADSIFRKFTAELGNDLTPERVQNLSHDQFRKSGISKSKEEFIRKLSEKFANDKGFLSQIAEKPDSEILSSLMELKGIGRWTAEMFMIFSLNRLDILPINDAGFRRSVSKFYLNGRKATDDDILRISDAWRPYRTIAVWYLWRGLDGVPKGPIQT
jgi:DNA-3-methyladenine glycosylase II